MNFPREQRLHKVCRSDLENEYHFVLGCNAYMYNPIRNYPIPKKFYMNPNLHTADFTRPCQYNVWVTQTIHSDRNTVVCWRCYWTWVTVLIKCTFFHVVFSDIWVNWLVDSSDSSMKREWYIHFRLTDNKWYISLWLKKQLNAKWTLFLHGSGRFGSKC